MMVGLAPENGHCAVNLLDDHYSYHLVRERHLREGYFAVGALIDLLAETVRSADDERQVTTGRHLLLQPIGKLDRAELLAVLVKQHHIHRGREETQHGFAFGGFDLFLGERLGVFEVRQHYQLKRHVVLEPFAVLVNERNETGVTRLPRYQQ